MSLNLRESGNGLRDDRHFGAAPLTSPLLAISALRYAWLLEGSCAQCLIELEGDPSIVRRIDALHDWTTFERELRAVQMDAATVEAKPSATVVEAPRIEIARAGPIPVLRSHILTWIDDAGRILGLGADGVILELPERVEATLDQPGGILARYWRRRDGSSCLRWRDAQIELPHEPEVDRRVHGHTWQGLLLTERRGADTRLRLLHTDGLHDGPLFRNLTAVVLPTHGNYAMMVSDIGGFSSLITMDLANWGWDRGAPWPEAAKVTDLAVLRTNQLVGVANVDGAGQLYVITTYTGELEHTIYVPCSDPRIVHADGASVWLTGASPSRFAARHDLFRVDLAPSVTTTMLTGSINASGWGSLHAARRDDGWILAYERRGLFVLGDSIEALVAFDDGEQITSIRTSPLLAAFTTDPEGSRLFLGEQQLAVINLPSRGYEPLLAER